MDLSDLLSGNAGLTGIQTLLRGRQARQVLRARLAALLPEAEWLGACCLRREKLKPSRKLTAYYDVFLRSRATHKPNVRPIAVTWTRAERDQAPEDEAIEMQNEAAERGLAAPFRQLWTAAPESNMRILVAPLDPLFRQLVRVSDPEHIRNLFGMPHSVIPIRYRPGQRHRLRYRPQSEGLDRDAVLFAKLYKSPEESASAFQIAHCAADRVAAGEARLAAVRPRAHIVDDAMVIYPSVTGKPLSHLLRSPDQALVAHLRDAGRALRSIHQASAPCADRLLLHTLGAETIAISRASEHVDALLPSVHHVIHAILDRAQSLYDRMAAERPTFCHGDFKADHLLISPGCLRLIDFDSCVLGDPALDVGKFLADLRWWFALYRHEGVEQASAQFLRGYGADIPSERLLRARLYQAVLLVKMSVRRVRLSDANWTARTRNLVNYADRLLTELEISL